jgi:hypothetical protein
MTHLMDWFTIGMSRCYLQPCIALLVVADRDPCPLQGILAAIQAMHCTVDNAEATFPQLLHLLKLGAACIIL